MATWIVGGVVLLITGGIVWKMIADKKNGKNVCGGDCAHCSMSCGPNHCNTGNTGGRT